MFIFKKTILLSIYTLFSIFFTAQGVESEQLSQNFPSLQTTRLVTPADHKEFLINTLI